MRPLFVGVVCAVVVGCSVDARGESEEWASVIDTIRPGLLRVVHQPPADEAITWHLEETLRVGSLDGDDQASFSRIKGLVVLSDERFAVLDDVAQEVRVFNADGTFAATLGGQGQGPGEFEGAYGLMLDDADRIWVPDARNRRLSVWDADDGLLWSTPTPILSFGFVFQGAMMTDGTMWKPTITLGPPRANAMRIYDDTGQPIDSLPMPPAPEVDMEDPPGAFVWTAADGSAMRFFGVPYYPTGERLIDPAGVLWTTERGDPTYRVARWTPPSDTSLVLEAHRPPPTIPTAARDSAIDALREQMQDFDGARQDWSKVPDVEPAVAGLAISDDGRLWVQTATESTELFDVYERSGEYVRSVESSLHFYRWVRPVIRGDDMWAVVTDDFDVHYVVRARAVRTGSPG